MNINITEELLDFYFKEATDAGSFCGSRQVIELSKKEILNDKLIESCGGSNLVLIVDGRSKLGKLLSKWSTKNGISINKAYGGGFSVILPYQIRNLSLVNGQERSIYKAADAAAVKVIKNRLDIDAYSMGYGN